MIHVLLAAAGFLLLSALAAVIGAEVLGWLSVLTRCLLRAAVRQLPAEHQTRYYEEWLCDIKSKAAERKLAALVWALGTCLGAHRLARALGAPSLWARLLQRRSARGAIRPAAAFSLGVFVIALLASLLLAGTPMLPALARAAVAGIAAEVVLALGLLARGWLRRTGLQLPIGCGRRSSVS